MYVAFLSAVLAAEDDEVVTNDSLLELALVCRHRMLGSRAEPGGSAQHELAYEVAYDHALVRLCAARGIEVDPGRFAHPRPERARLERALGAGGVDLRGATPIGE